MLIRPKDKENLIQIFSEANIPFEVWAYGSRVNGTAHSGSDLDLVIREKDGNQIHSELFSFLYNKIKDSNIPILIELRDWTKIPDSFKINIQNKHEVLYSNID
ncbi:MAG: nucleotidyltransferase domain-containing protein [Bacteroidota bacterium]|jgi:predicted nucleotidyltransferase